MAEGKRCVSIRLRNHILSYLNNDDPTTVPMALAVLSDNPRAIPHKDVVQKLWAVLFSLRGSASESVRAAHQIDGVFRHILEANKSPQVFTNVFDQSSKLVELVGDICSTLQFVRASALRMRESEMTKTKCGNEKELAGKVDDSEESSSPCTAILRVRLDLICRLLEIGCCASFSKKDATKVADSVSRCCCDIFGIAASLGRAPKALFLLPQVFKLLSLFATRCKQTFVPQFSDEFHELIKSNPLCESMLSKSTLLSKDRSESTSSSGPLPKLMQRQQHKVLQTRAKLQKVIDLVSDSSASDTDSEERKDATTVIDLTCSDDESGARKKQNCPQPTQSMPSKGSIFQNAPAFDPSHFLTEDESCSKQRIKKVFHKPRAIGMQVPQSLVRQLKLTDTQRCGITDSRPKDGICFPWITAEGFLMFVGYDAYQRLCRTIRDPSLVELVEGLHLRLRLESIWVSLCNLLGSDELASWPLKRESSKNTVVINDILRDHNIVSSQCRLLLTLYVDHACENYANQGALVHSKVHKTSIQPSDKAFFLFAKSVETSKRECMQTWSKRVCKHTVTREYYGLGRKRKREEIIGGEISKRRKM